MGYVTNIEWAHSTFNCWIGCQVVSLQPQSRRPHPQNLNPERGKPPALVTQRASKPSPEPPGSEVLRAPLLYAETQAKTTIFLRVPTGARLASPPRPPG
jgi:hypothetical protein